MKKFTIDCGEVRSFADFVAATNLGFVELLGGKWNGNLDAFNDYLSWPEETEYELELRDTPACARSLGHAAQSKWLRERLGACDPSHAGDLRRRLAAAEAGQGETLFDVIKEIISAKPHVRLLLH